MRIVISSGHGKYVRGASGYIDEVDEARRVVDRVTAILSGAGVPCTSYHDDVSRSQNENLHRIVDFHNAQTRDLDVSVHFNSNGSTTAPKGAMCLYVTQQSLSAKVSHALSQAMSIPDLGAVYRGNLYFLNNTEKPAILIETCFVTSKFDSDSYQAHFETVCKSIAATISGGIPVSPPATGLFMASGKCSSFGGPSDTGVSPSEGLAFIQSVSDAPHLFLPYQPEGTSGLARRLNPYTHYIACRWNYDVTPKSMLLEHRALIRANGMEFKVFPADWGPHEDTGRVADLSPSLMEDLRLTTDDSVEVVFPAEDALTV